MPRLKQKKRKSAKRLTRSFYTQPTLKVAKDLLGKYIVRKIGDRKLTGKIVETEAYIGPGDKASHAYGGRITSRNWIEYLDGGYIYIYLVYGLHWQLNITTNTAGRPECVLIRALDGDILADGPGKVCRYLRLNKSFYGEDLTTSRKIWVVDKGERTDASRIKAKQRIGIDYAGSYWSRRRWRFVLNG
jgi:DNA-3-methyladenine glycosylase